MSYSSGSRFRILLILLSGTNETILVVGKSKSLQGTGRGDRSDVKCMET